MVSFPKLRTKAVAQYPFHRDAQVETFVLRFLGGNEQRFKMRDIRRRWVIRLDLLDDQEILQLEEFFRINQGMYGSFTFVDPFDGSEYPDCSFEQEELIFLANAEARYYMDLSVRQNS